MGSLRGRIFLRRHGRMDAHLRGGDALVGVNRHSAFDNAAAWAPLDESHSDIEIIAGKYRFGIRGRTLRGVFRQANLNSFLQHRERCGIALCPLIMRSYASPAFSSGKTSFMECTSFA